MNIISINILFLLLLNFSNIESLQYMKHGFNFVMKKLEGVIDESVKNTECGKDLGHLIQDLIQKKRWAVQMIDASAKIEPGLLVGNINQVGNYDECLDIKEINDKFNVSGQYCTIIIKPKSGVDLVSAKSKGMNSGFTDPIWFLSLLSSKAIKFLNKHMTLMKMSYGVCIPSSCSVENLRSIWEYFDHNLSPLVTLDFDDFLCNYKEKSTVKIGIEPLIIAGFVLYFFLLMIATIYELYFFDGDEESLSSYLCTLSLRRNASKLFSTHVGEDNIPCINGLKVFSMMWILIGHRFLVNALMPNVNSLYIIDWKDNLNSMPIVGATVSVDTFLAISGLLVSYIYLRYTTLKNVKVNMASFYALRIFRLSPPLFAMICIYIAILKYFNDGPLWSALTAKLSTDCLFYGWTNLLYVNNFINLTNQCMLQSWYLSVDSQLYFLFPLIFFSIKNNPKRTLYGMFLLGCVSSISAFMVTIQYGFSSLLDMRYGDNMYQSSFFRMPVWLIGVATGYFIFKYKDQKIEIPTNLKFSIWLLSFIFMNLIVFGQVILTNENDPIYSAIFNAFARPIWALITCWIIFACVTQNGGFLDSFLSLPIFNFVAKITYSLFLVHIMVILTLSGGKRHVDHFNNLRAVHEFFGDTIFSVVIAIIFSILFESPVITFAKKYFRRYENDFVEDEKRTTVIRYVFWFFPVRINDHNMKQD